MMKPIIAHEKKGQNLPFQENTTSFTKRESMFVPIVKTSYLALNTNTTQEVAGQAFIRLWIKTMFWKKKTTLYG